MESLRGARFPLAATSIDVFRIPSPCITAGVSGVTTETVYVSNDPSNFAFCSTGVNRKCPGRRPTLTLGAEERCSVSCARLRAFVSLLSQALPPLYAPARGLCMRAGIRVPPRYDPRSDLDLQETPGLLTRWKLEHWSTGALEHWSTGALERVQREPDRCMAVLEASGVQITAWQTVPARDANCNGRCGSRLWGSCR